jgi:hypothetical protein
MPETRSFLARIALSAALTAFAFFAFPAKAAPPDGQQQFAALGECKLDSGQEITGCRLGYRTWGKLNADGSIPAQPLNLPNCSEQRSFCSPQTAVTLPPAAKPTS